MSRHIFLLAFVLSLPLVTACGGDSDSDSGTDTAADATTGDETAERPETIIDDHLKAMDRARALEDDILQHQDDKLKKIDEQSGG